MNASDHAATISTTPILTFPTTQTYDGGQGDYLDAGHSAELALASGTVSVGFRMDGTQGRYALISKDGKDNHNGEFTVWVDDGQIRVTMEDDGTSRTLRVPDLVVEAGVEYQFAMTFGPDGLEAWLNGALVAAAPEVTFDLTANTSSLVIGGTRAWSNPTDDAHSLFRGEIGHVHIYGEQLDGPDMMALARAVDPALDDAAMMAAMMDDLQPSFAQAHHGSHTFQYILEDYGVSAHGHFAQPLAMQMGTMAANGLTGTDAADGLNGMSGNDTVDGAGGDDVLQGGYGNDDLTGGDGNDILDGGHGEDILDGGAGDDLLISRSDAREPYVAFDPNRDEGDPLGELTNGKLYPDQPIPGNDVLIGGTGSDIFYFQTLINAKERYIEKHTRSDGTINWHGVAGENDSIHDHWVDHQGHDVVMDFSRDEGDRLVIEGHTTEISGITYGDSNGDGVLDHSVIHLYSEQGNGGGAHADDELGTITVYGDLVRMSDIEHTAAPAYGIVTTIEDLDEALTPETNGTSRGNITPPDTLTVEASPTLPGGATPVFGMTEDLVLDRWQGDYLDAGHSAELALASGTVSVGFRMDGTQGRYALISKDGKDNHNGEFTVWVDDGQIRVTMEDDGTSRTLRVPDLVVEAGVEYQFAMTFGPDGLEAWLNGALVAAAPEVTFDLTANTSSLVIGGTRAWSNPTDDAHSLFRGEIGHVHIYGEQLDGPDMMALARAVDPALDDAAMMAAMMDDLQPSFAQAHHGSHTFQYILEDYGVSAHGHFAQPLAMQMGTMAANGLTGTDAADGLNGMSGNDTVDGAGGDDVLQGGYGNDDLTGGDGNDILDGGHGEDILDGGAGDDLLISRSDAREPYVAFDPNRDEGDPLGELTNGKLYPDQPIPGNDVLIGGTGSDIFYFQTLINAKERYIEKHTRSDGTINWHGVAGENDSIHDHWVDHQGHDVVMDFSRDEGDRLVIEGHTTEISGITYGDSNGDGVLDHSVIHLYSEQGNGGGAHADDELGTITVYGDLVRMSDIEHTAAPAYGIVTTIEDLDEALTPETNGISRGNITPPADLGSLADFETPGGLRPIFVAGGEYHFQPQQNAPLILGTGSDLTLSQGTISMSFNVMNLRDYSALFSKDAQDFGDGGHVSAYVQLNGDLVVRIQSTEKSHWMVAQGAVQEGKDYDFAFTFGPNGAEVYLDGARLSRMTDVPFDLSQNTEALVVGAGNWRSTEGTTDRVGNHFDGTISDVMVFDEQLAISDLPVALTLPPPPPPAGSMVFDFAMADGSVTQDINGDIVVEHKGVTHIVAPDAPALAFTDRTVNLSDMGSGSSKAEVLTGGDLAEALTGFGGADSLFGAEGDDTLNGGDGDDILNGGLGADRLNGGNGTDTADYSGSVGSLRVDLMFAQLNTNIAQGDSYDSIENLIGSRGFDNLRGTMDANAIEGRANVDYIYGRAGDDTLDGGIGDDVLFGGAGADLLIGGANIDRAQYSGSQTGLTIDLGNSARNTGEAAGDIYVDIEGLAGSEFADQIAGDNADNFLFGRIGADTISGGGGDDYLNGGAHSDRLNGGMGDDTLRGGTHDDTFVFDGGADVIEDLNLAQGDMLELNGSALGLSGLSAADVIADFGGVSSGQAVLDFGSGNSVSIQSLSSLAGLEDHLIIV